MANFVKSKLARESVEATGDVIDGLSNVEPAEENIDVQLAEVASIDGQLEQLDGDQETLAADTERTEAAIDAADEKSKTVKRCLKKPSLTPKWRRNLSVSVGLSIVPNWHANLIAAAVA